MSVRDSRNVLPHYVSREQCKRAEWAQCQEPWSKASVCVFLCVCVCACLCVLSRIVAVLLPDLYCMNLLTQTSLTVAQHFTHSSRTVITNTRPGQHTHTHTLTHTLLNSSVRHPHVTNIGMRLCALGHLRMRTDRCRHACSHTHRERAQRSVACLLTMQGPCRDILTVHPQHQEVLLYWFLLTKGSSYRNNLFSLDVTVCCSRQKQIIRIVSDQNLTFTFTLDPSSCSCARKKPRATKTSLSFQLETVQWWTVNGFFVA